MIRRFYLADDDDDDTLFFGEALKDIDESIQFGAANDGEELLEKLHQNKSKPQIIFLDINMPRMNGWEALKNLKMDESLKDIYVIMYSTTSSASDGEKALQSGAIAFYEKPTNYLHLKEFLKIISDSSPEELKTVLRRISDSEIHKVYSE
jgi:CheY-like chemotaxis protein